MIEKERNEQKEIKERREKWKNVFREKREIDDKKQWERERRKKKNRIGEKGWERWIIKVREREEIKIRER